MSGSGVARREMILRATAALHADICQSMWWSEDCRRPDGGRHARETARPVIVEALRQSEKTPAEYVHDKVCHAMLDGAVQGGCPARERHIAVIAERLGLDADGGS